jgi:hypothetical protein
MMGNKLGDNNPDIADLSDKNRPTKIAEKNTELYDNEWTDAFEVFQTKYSTEKETIEKLLQMLQVHVHQFCIYMSIRKTNLTVIYYML